MHREKHQPVLFARNSVMSNFSALVLIFLFVFSPLAQVYAEEATVAPVDAVDTTLDSSTPNIDSGATSTDLSSVVSQDENVVVPIVPDSDTATNVDNTEDTPKDSPEANTATTSYTQMFTPESLTSQLLSNTNVKVNEINGSFDYVYTIDLPPGRNALQPDVSLQYKSEQAKSNSNIFGSGWDVSIPYIQRLNKTGVNKLYTDNYFTSSLSGELVNSSGAQYVPKVENGDYLNYSFTGTSWVVTDKNGTTYTFGASSSSRQDDASGTNVYKWMLVETRDTNDNFISYSYFKDAGQIYPDKITYTGNGTVKGKLSVEFYRDSSIRPDNMVSFQSGFPVVTNYRINGIKTFVGLDWVRNYELTYSSGDNGVRSILQSITESGQNTSVIDILPPTTFDYFTSTPGWTMNLNTFTAPETLSNGYQSFLDLNGDSLPDLIESYQNTLGSQMNTFINTGHHTWSLLASLAPPILFRQTEIRGGAYQDQWDQGVRIGDLNGDLFPDILKSEDNANGNGGVDAYVNQQGNSWLQDVNAWLATTALNGDSNINSWGSDFIDMNNDGLVDIFHKFSNDPEIQLNNGTTFDSASTTWDPPTVNGIRGPFVQMSDVNGDGLPDIIETYYSNFNTIENKNTYLNNGDGNWSLDVGLTSPQMLNVYGVDGGFRFIDVNNDGLNDLVKESFPQPDTYINTGVGWVQNSAWFIPADLPDIFSTSPIGIADFDRDGSIDFMRTRNYAGYYDTETWTNNTQVQTDLLAKVITPEGLNINITFAKTSSYVDSSGDLLNPHLPFALDTVSSITTTDPVGGAVSADSYSYEGGEYYYNGVLDRKLAGFSKVIHTDALDNKTITYYHQGNATNSTQGEYDDAGAKIGKPYRTEVYDSTGNLYKKTINKWDCASGTCNGTQDYVFLADTIVSSYDGGSTHRDAMEEYTYDTSNGNLVAKTEHGEVAGNDDGTYSEIAGDERYTTNAYATASYGATSLPCQQTVTDAYGLVSETLTYYDNQSLCSATNGNPTEVDKAISSGVYAVEHRTYNSTYGVMDSSTDANGNQTNYTYASDWIYPSSVRNALGQNTDYTYDFATGKVTSVQDDNGFTFTTDYDGLGRLVKEVIPDPVTGTATTKRTLAYTTSSIPNMILEDVNFGTSQHRKSYTYLDGFGRAVQERKEAEVAGQYIVKDTLYDILGNVAAQSLPYFDSGASMTVPTAVSTLLTTYTYDPLGRVTNSYDALGHTGYSYDDWRVSTEDPRGHAKYYTYDAYNNLVQVDEFNGASQYTTTYIWDGNNKLKHITDALGNIRDFTYDNLGRRLSADDLRDASDGVYGSWQYQYDDAGNVVRTYNPMGDEINYSYDALNRPLTEDSNSTGALDVEYVYDICTNGISHLCKAITPDTLTTYTYTPNALVKTEAKKITGTGTHTTSYTYDLQSNVLTETYPDGAVTTTTYNQAILPETIAFTASGGSPYGIISDATYAPNGKPSEIDYGNGVKEVDTRDATKKYLLTHKLTQTAGVNLQDIAYSYDATANIESITDASNTTAAKNVTYQYDDLNRLVDAIAVDPATSATIYHEVYTYNAIGNILTGPLGAYAYDGNTNPTNADFANPHAPTDIAGGGNYTYDKNGNTLTINALTNTFDYKNQLLTTTTPSTSVSYVYDHAGIRASQSVNSDDTFYPTSHYTIDTNSSTNIHHIYLGADMVSSVEDISGTTKYHFTHTDQITGSNVTSDSNGNLEETIDYYPYGDIRIDTSVSGYKDEKKFTNHYYDPATDLTYMGARYYNAKSGQFMTEDPSFLMIGIGDSGILMNPQQLNSYAYATGNPIINIDPDGKFSANAALGGAWSEVKGTVTGTLSFFGNMFAYPFRTAENMAASTQYVKDNLSSIIQGKISEFKNGTDEQQSAMIGVVSTNLATFFVGELKNVAKLGEVRGIAESIGGGHAWEKHVINQGEFKGLVTTQDDFINHIENVINNPTETKSLRNGRSAYWHSETNTTVIHNPNELDRGTALQPLQGKKYFDGLK